MTDKGSQVPNPTTGVPDLEEELIGTRLVAKLLGVGPTSVRRYRNETAVCQPYKKLPEGIASGASPMS